MLGKKQLHHHWQSKILDLACGRGRHSIYLHKMGFEVIGTDLSKNSIDLAKKHEQPGLSFKVQDMSKALGLEFDAVFNLFKHCLSSAK